MLVVVGPSHGRRYRRALRRAWPEGNVAPVVVTTPYALFRADDWWQSRTTVREGLVEFEKLVLDYARHPWNSEFENQELGIQRFRNSEFLVL